MNEFFRIKSKEYATIPNTFLKDRNLSNKAKGVLAMILALPDDWDFSIKGMVSVTKDGEASLRTAINELKQQEYCYVQPVRIAGKIARWKYYFSGEKITESLLCDFLKVENLKVENRAQYNNIINKESTKLKDYSDCHYSNNNPSNPKAQDEELDFEQSFYKLYPLKKGKPCAERAWKKLSQKDRQAAIDKLPAYIADCVTNKRSFKYPATYLNQRTWEDDFGVRQKISFYDPLDSDSDEKRRFKAWMRLNYPEIENTALPLSYEDYMAMIKDSSVDAISTYLEEVNAEIFKYRKSDIAWVVRQRIREEEL